MTTEAPGTILPRALGTPPLSARVRVQPEDFVVREQALVEPDGEGQHLLLYVRKRERTTAEVATALARVAGVPPQAVSWAGLKDRFAVTEQWFSLDLAGRDVPTFEDSDDFQVLAVHRHGRKLRRGALAANAFALVLRDLSADPELLVERLAAVGARGVPNYFGPQRFGRGGANVARARQMFARRRRASRHERGLLLSAARAELFNRMLAQRVQRGDWDQAQAGDVLQWAGSRSHFCWQGEEPERIEDALRQLELHPTGALWGRGRNMAEGAVGELEHAVAEQDAELASGLVHAGVDMARRSLRLGVADGRAEIADDGTVTVAFTLPPGGYATSVLRELVEESPR